MTDVLFSKSIVSVEWLQSHLNASNLVVLNVSYPQSEEQIQNTRYFDIKKKFSVLNAPFPNTLPSAEQFIEEARKLGINNDSAIVVYDDRGIYWSARVWYMFKAFRYNNVAVLSGGLLEWKRLGFATESIKEYQVEYGDFNGNYNPKFFKFFEDIKKESLDESHTIVDARSSDRFNCVVVEPRAGLRSGTIPNSINLPYTDLLDNGCLKSEEDLKTIFNLIVKTNDQLTFSCGSGITACVLALGAEISGYKNISVYGWFLDRMGEFG